MSIAKQTYLYCDGGNECGLQGECFDEASLESATKQRKRAARAGWVRRNGLDFCPSCAEARGLNKRAGG